MNATARALLALARLTRPELRNLGELRQAVSDSGQAAAIADLERAAYGAGKSDSLSFADLARLFAHGPAFGQRTRRVEPASALPELYPG